MTELTTGRAAWAAMALLAMSLAWGGPKNIFLLIGDGMSPDTEVATGAYLFGKDYVGFGGTKKLSWEVLKGKAFVTTYPVSGGYDPTWGGGNGEYPWRRATDSAAAGTAMSAGVKTYYGAVGVDKNREPVKLITEHAKERGMRTGVVSTMAFPNATPATFGAHATSRSDYTGISHGMLYDLKLDVIMGGGHPDEAPQGIPGRPDLTAKMVKWLYITEPDWEAIKAGKTDYVLVDDRDEFRKLIVSPPKEKVLGLFREHGQLKPRMADNSQADDKLPTLQEMALGALAKLENPKGFVVMIEGGAIDEREHVNDADGAIGETIAFNETVALVMKWIEGHGGWQDNLLMVTADHCTGYIHDVKQKGVGVLPEMMWGTDGTYGGHTNRLVNIWYQGAGSETMDNALKPIDDFERGKVKVIDNTDIFKTMFAALPPA